MSANGKGDKSRVRDTKRFRENYDAIQWRKTKPVSATDFVAHLIKKCPNFVQEFNKPMKQWPGDPRPTPPEFQDKPGEDPWRPMRHWDE